MRAGGWWEGRVAMVGWVLLCGRVESGGKQHIPAAAAVYMSVRQFHVMVPSLLPALPWSAGRDLGSSLPALLHKLVAVLPADGRCMLRVGMTNPPFILEHLEEIAAILQVCLCSLWRHVRCLTLCSCGPELWSTELLVGVGRGQYCLLTACLLACHACMPARLHACRTRASSPTCTSPCRAAAMLCSRP